MAINKTHKVVVVGATGNIGRSIVRCLANSQIFAHAEVTAVASAKSLGRKISYGDKQILTLRALAEDVFSAADLAIFAAGSNVSKTWVPKALASGCTVIDKTSCFRMQTDVPLVVPEINHNLLTKDTRLISSPNCVAVPLSLVINPIYQKYPIDKVFVATYQSVSGAGKEAITTLDKEAKEYFMHGGYGVDKTTTMAFNVIPQIGPALSSGDSQEEHNIKVETNKILTGSADALDIYVTSVRTPVYIGHCMSVMITLKPETNVQSLADIYALWQQPGLKVVKDDKYITPMQCVGEPDVFISRVRYNEQNRVLLCWIVCDNLLKGGGLNVVQIAEVRAAQAN